MTHPARSGSLTTDQGDVATKDRRFYEQFGIDIPDIRAMLTNAAAAGGVVQGVPRSAQQTSKGNVLVERAAHRAQSQGEEFLALDRGAAAQERDSKLYLDRAYLERGHFRRRCSGTVLLQKSARRREPREARSGRNVQAPSRFATAHQYPRRRAPRQRVRDNLVEAGLGFMTDGAGLRTLGANPAWQSIAEMSGHPTITSIRP